MSEPLREANDLAGPRLRAATDTPEEYPGAIGDIEIFTAALAGTGISADEARIYTVSSTDITIRGGFGVEPTPGTALQMLMGGAIFRALLTGIFAGRKAREEEEGDRT